MMINLKRHSGFTILEVIISLALTAMLSVIVVGGMIAHGRSARSNISQIHVSEHGRKFLQSLYGDVTDGVGLGINETAPGSVAIGDILTLFRTTDPVVTVVQYQYFDTDGNPNTINDNVILRRTVDAMSDATAMNTGDIVSRWCSKAANTPVFVFDTNSDAPLVNVRLRIGDRTNPPSNTDNALTGRGYQSFFVNTFISREEPRI